MNKSQLITAGHFGEEKITSLPTQIIQRIKIDPVTKCWNWTGTLRPDGYGLIYLAELKKQLRVHRVVYELLVKKIESGLVIDHLCRNRKCVNPNHLEQVSIKTNTLRGISPVVQKKNQTHCKYGHELLGENLYIHPKRNTRNCKKCSNSKSQMRRDGLLNTGFCKCGNTSYAKGKCQSCYMHDYRKSKRG